MFVRGGVIRAVGGSETGTVTGDFEAQTGLYRFDDGALEVDDFLGRLDQAFAPQLAVVARIDERGGDYDLVADALELRRAVVGAAGMIVELLVASIAMFVWLAVEPGLVRTTAYNVMLIAGISTVLFNGNPLLRFDGYYVLSDLIEKPSPAEAPSNLAVAARYVFSPAIFDARSRRSPAIKVNFFFDDLATIKGWITPFSRIELANSVSSSWSNIILG